MFKEAVSYGVAGAVGGILGVAAGVGIVLGAPIYLAYRTSGEFRTQVDELRKMTASTSKKKKRNLATVSKLQTEDSNPTQAE